MHLVLRMVSIIVITISTVGMLVMANAPTKSNVDNDGGRVVVVGAGISGLTAAAVLQAHDINVVVLEADERIGGRLWTLDAESGFDGIDVGGHWLHGGSAPTHPVRRFCDARNIRTMQPAPNLYDAMFAHVVDWDGAAIGELQKSDAFAHYEKLVALATKLCEARKMSGQADISVAAAFAQVSVHMLPLHSEAAQRLFRLIVTLVIGAQEGAALEDLSCFDSFVGRTYYEFGDYDGQDLVCVGGISKLYNELAKGLDIRLGTPVRRIEVLPQSKAMGQFYGNASEHRGRVKLTVHGEGVVNASTAIVSVPLGILKLSAPQPQEWRAAKNSYGHSIVKSAGLDFKPPLPSAKLAAIGRLGYGALNSMVIRFNRPFWPAKIYTWAVAKNSTSCNTSLGYPCVPVVLNAAPECNDQPVLSVHGNGGELPKENDAAIAAAMETLRAVFPKDLPQEPFVATHISRWTSDEWRRGAYSHTAVGSSGNDRTVLATPEASSALLFAGEATCRMMYATVHGAFVSGLREARRVLESRGIAPCSFRPEWRDFLDDTTIQLCEDPPQMASTTRDQAMRLRIERHGWLPLRSTSHGHTVPELEKHV